MQTKDSYILAVCMNMMFHHQIKIYRYEQKKMLQHKVNIEYNEMRGIKS